MGGQGLSAGGGVLSPLLWCLMIDGLIARLNREGFLAIGYTDDLAILVRGPHLSTLAELSQRALDVVEEWCRETGLAVNPTKAGLVVFTRKYKVDSFVGPTLCGCELVPSDSVKYLGVTLDRKLLWKEHLEIQCRKFASHFWVCRRTFGLSWGIRPGIIYWLYCAVLRPRLLYTAVVWWPRVEKKTAIKMLEHARALVLRGALGAMRTTPVAAMGVLLEVEPLHLAVVAAAAAAAYRLRCIGAWKERSRHSRLPVGLLSDPIFEMRQDRMGVPRNFGKCYKVVFPSREQWTKHNVPWVRNGEVWYTDGSKIGSGAGAGLWCNKGSRCGSISLGRHATVFQAEVLAILTSAQLALEAGTRGRRISFCSDSQAALMALDVHHVNSRLVWECRTALNELGKDNSVTIVWIPGHSGIKGNEIVDTLAKAGALSELTGPEPALGIPSCAGRREYGPGLGARMGSSGRISPGLAVGRLMSWRGGSLGASCRGH